MQSIISIHFFPSFRPNAGYVPKYLYQAKKCHVKTRIIFSNFLNAWIGTEGRKMHCTLSRE